MTEYRETAPDIVAWRGRIAFDAATRPTAEWLARLTEATYGVGMTEAVGAFAFALSPDRLCDVAPFLAFNRNGLYVELLPATSAHPDGDAHSPVRTFDAGPRAGAPHANSNRPVSWHLHIYFPSAEIDKAHWLRGRMAEKFAVAIYPVEDGAGGPHPLPNLEVQASRAELPRILPWLALNRQGLSVHVHPRSEDLIGDHLDWALWLGTPFALIADELDGVRPPGADEGLEWFNGAPREPPSPDPRFPPTA